MSGGDDPLGVAINYAGAALPHRAPLEGAFVRLEPLEPARHGDDLWQGACETGGVETWAYLPYGPFAGRGEYDAHLSHQSQSADPLFFAIVRQDCNCARGIASFANIVADMGVIEIGHVWFAPSLQRSREATEAMFLMMREAFDGLGNRRLVWKCNALNQRSKHAAERLGFTCEGTSRQHRVWKGRNRDTDWLSVIDGEWPPVRRNIETWLRPENFDSDGTQRFSLSERQARRQG